MRVPAIRLVVFKLFAQTWISYRDSPAVAGGRSCHADLHAGDRVPNLRFDPGDRRIPTSLFDVIGDAQHHLILFEELRPEPGQVANRQALTELLDRYEITVPVHVVPTGRNRLQRRHADDPCLWLVRPDGHIAYADSLARLDRLAAYMDELYLHREGQRRRPQRENQGHRRWKLLAPTVPDDTIETWTRELADATTPTDRCDLRPRVRWALRPGALGPSARMCWALRVHLR
jgi:hypothetical protein